MAHATERGASAATLTPQMSSLDSRPSADTPCAIAVQAPPEMAKKWTDVVAKWQSAVSLNDRFSETFPNCMTKIGEDFLEDLLLEEKVERWYDVMHTPAPDIPSLVWKLHQILDDFGGCKSVAVATAADLTRILGEPNHG